MFLFYLCLAAKILCNMYASRPTPVVSLAPRKMRLALENTQRGQQKPTGHCLVGLL